MLEEQVSDFNVALEGDKLFQKFIARKVSREQEVQFNLLSGEVLVGFITGLDENWIQITSSIKHSAHLVSIHSLSSITPTGRSLKHLTERDREKINGYAFAMKKSSEEALVSG